MKRTRFFTVETTGPHWASASSDKSNFRTYAALLEHVTKKIADDNVAGIHITKDLLPFMEEDRNQDKEIDEGKQQEKE